MKQFFTLFAALLVLSSASVASNLTVIEEQPEGEEVVYARTGGYAYHYDYDEESVSIVEPTGAISVVYGDDGKVYMKNPIFDNEYETWIEGTTNADRTKLTFKTGQSLISTDYYGYGILIYAGKLDDDGIFYVKDMTVTEFTYTIDQAAGTMSLDVFNDSSYILAIFNSDDDTWAAGGEYSSTFAVDTPSVPVTPPAGLVTETWYVNGDEMDEESLCPLEEYTVELGIDGSDVYVKGISVYFPDAWIKGTADASGTVTFNNRDLLGEMYGYDIFFVGYDPDTNKLIAPVFTYDAASLSYSTENAVVINEDKYSLSSWQTIYNMVISKRIATAVENVDAEVKAVKAVKTIENGNLVIRHNGKKFNLVGIEL